MKNIRTSNILIVLLIAVFAFIGGYILTSFFHSRFSQNSSFSSNSTSQVAGVFATSTPTPIPLKGTIIFVSNREQNWEIYKMDLATLYTENLTSNPANDMNPQLSPDGNSMIFFSDRNGANAIYMMNFSTGKTIQLTTQTSSSYDPSFSPDGRMIVFKSNKNDKDAGNGDIFIMKADGTGQKNLTIDRKTTEEWDPSFTSDGEKIVFVSRLDSETEHDSDEIFMMDVDGKNVVQVTNNLIPDWYPSIDPTNQRLLFISDEAPNEDDDVYTSNLDGASRQRLTSIPGDNSDPSWSQDGSKIVFLNNSDGDYDLYIMNSDGSDVRKIEDTKGDELSPIFVPDDKLGFNLFGIFSD